MRTTLGDSMAKASRLLLLLATIALFVLAIIMLLNSDSGSSWRFH